LIGLSSFLIPLLPPLVAILFSSSMWPRVCGDWYLESVWRSLMAPLPLSFLLLPVALVAVSPLLFRLPAPPSFFNCAHGRFGMTPLPRTHLVRHLCYLRLVEDFFTPLPLPYVRRSLSALLLYCPVDGLSFFFSTQVFLSFRSLSWVRSSLGPSPPDRSDGTAQFRGCFLFVSIFWPLIYVPPPSFYPFFFLLLHCSRTQLSARPFF